MVAQARVIDPGHTRVGLQKLRHAQRVVAVLLHAQRQGLDALQNLPSAHGAERCAKHAQAFHAAAHGKAKVAKGLVKLHTVVALGRLGHTGKLAVVPREFAALHHHAAQRGAVPGQVFGGRMHHDVCAQRQRIAQQRAGHGVVDDQRHAVRVGHLGHGRDVQHHHARVAQAFGIHCPRVGPHGSRKVFGLCRIDKSGFDAELGQAHGQHGDRAAIQSPGRHHMVARLQEGHQRHGFGRHARGTGHGSTPALECCNALFEHRHRGVAQARIHIAKGLQVEQRRRVLGAVKHEAAGLVNRQGACARGCIGNLPGVDGQSFGMELAVGHGGGDQKVGSKNCNCMDNMSAMGRDACLYL